MSTTKKLSLEELEHVQEVHYAYKFLKVGIYDKNNELDLSTLDFMVNGFTKTHGWVLDQTILVGKDQNIMIAVLKRPVTHRKNNIDYSGLPPQS